MLETNNIYHGNCLDIMGKFPDNCIDVVVTDPPYALTSIVKRFSKDNSVPVKYGKDGRFQCLDGGFMGAKWDSDVPSVETWKEILRLLKPGAFAFVMCTPRQDSLARMIVRLTDAGFNTGFTSIYWCYAQGFPKAANIGKMVDKRWKKKTEYDELAEYLKNARIKKGLSQKEIAELFPSKIGGLTSCVWNWENGLNVPTQEQWVKLKTKLDLNNQFDWLIEQKTKKYEEAERDVIGKKEWTNSANHFVPNANHKQRVQLDETVPTTPKGKAFDGWYTFNPKPAVEVVIVCQKPMTETTYVGQALAWYEQKEEVQAGKRERTDIAPGCVNFGDCRIPYENEGDKQKSGRGGIYGNSKPSTFLGDIQIMHGNQNNQGRFPANMICGSGIDINIDLLIEAKNKL